MERRDRNHYRDRDRRRYENSEHHRPGRDRDRQKDRSRSRRRSSSKSRHERDRNRHRSRSSSCNRNKRSPHRSRSKKEYREEREHRKSTPPPPPSISAVESIISYQSSSRKDKEVTTRELLKQSSPDVISQLERHNKKPGAYCNLRPDEPIDKEKIHKEIEEKLRETLAREGIEYNAPKPEATHPVFANDGSFLEIFKKMQEAQQPEIIAETQLHQPSSLYAPPPMMSTSIVPLRPQLPIFGRRRGGKILKTGVVAKPKNSDNDSNTDPKDFWTIYLREVNKYKNAACDSDAQSRPLVK